MKSIHIKNIDFAYKKGNSVFQDFNLHLSQQESEGKIIALMGASGSGKSTLLKLLLGIEQPVSGSIEMLPVNPVFSYVPQEAVLFEHLSTKDNARYFQFAGGFKKRFNKGLYTELIESLGLEDVINSKKTVLELSGGQKQLLSLLRALSIEPDFLLLDEPCNGLDAEVKRAFLNKLREITQRYGLFVLYITHHKLEAQLIADDVLYLVQDKKTGTVHNSALASVQIFIDKPPVMHAAQVFRFPDIKLLPMSINESGKIIIAKNENDIAQYWLVDDKDISIDRNDGFPFKVISKSPMYVVIRHEASATEWMLPNSLLKANEAGENIFIKINNKSAVYSKYGILLN